MPFYSSYAFGGSAVASANVAWSPAVTGQPVSGFIDITLLAAELMGSGTYHDTVHVKVCTDSQCANQVQGSPITINVTYTVTGNSVSDAGYAVVPTSLYFEAPPTDP